MSVRWALCAGFAAWIGCADRGAEQGACIDASVSCVTDTTYRLCDDGRWSEERPCPGVETCMAMDGVDMCMER